MQAKIIASRDLFDFDEGGFMAEIINVRHENWEAGDLLAWEPGKPEKWWTQKGFFDVLGLPCFHIHEESGAPIHIYRTPETWTKHKGNGVVALYWPMARITLSRVTLIAEDEKHRAEIDRHYRMPRPKILIQNAG